MARENPLKALCFLLLGVLHGGVSAKRALSLLLRSTAPGTYGRVRDAIVTRRGA